MDVREAAAILRPFTEASVTVPVHREALSALLDAFDAAERLANQPDAVLFVVLADVIYELTAARERHAPMQSAHEGHSVIREEFEELWEHVRAETGSSREARAEAIQLATMALRYVLDVCDREAA